MIRLLIQNWWLLLVRGIFAIAFAIFVFFFLPFVPAPLLQELAYAGLVALFGLFAIVSGLVTIAAAVRGAGQGGASWLLLTDGIVVTAGGLVILVSRGLTLAVVIQLIALTALSVGILEIVAGLHLRRHLTDEWLLIAGGIVSAAFALCLFLARGGEVQAILRWVSLYALVSGLAIVGLSFRVRKLRGSVHALAKHPVAAKTQGQSGTA